MTQVSHTNGRGIETDRWPPQSPSPTVVDQGGGIWADAESRAVVRALIDAYAGEGITVEIHTELEGYREAKLQARGIRIPPCYETGDGLWVVGRDRKGDICHLQATVLNPSGSLMMELGPMALDYADCGDHEPIVRSERLVERELTGLLVYHGEMWLRRDWRGRYLAGSLGKLAVIASYRKWRMDYVWGLVLPSRANPGYMQVVGHKHWGPGVRWFQEDGSEVLNEYVCWLGRRELEKTIRALALVCDRQQSAGEVISHVYEA